MGDREDTGAVPPLTRRSGVYHRLSLLRNERLTATARNAIRRGQLRALGVAASKDMVAAWVREQWLLARQGAVELPWKRAGQAYAEVRDVLQARGIRHFVVSQSPYRPYTVAVSGDDWGRLPEALAAAAADEPLYVEGRARTRRHGVSSSVAAAGTPFAASMIAASDSLKVFRLVADKSTGRIVGYADACTVQRWSRDGDRLVSPVPNPTAEYITASYLDDTELVDSAAGVAERRLSRAPRQVPERVTFPIDLVYMWVDGSDPAWRERFTARLRAEGRFEQADESDATAAWRFRDHNELMYSLRSVEMYAPWVRNIHLVTDRQIPVWLDTSNPRIHIHFHDEIFTDPSALPVFNSHAIGTQLHHIEGLSEHYLYMNDDILFGRVVEPELFFTATGKACVRHSRTHSPIADEAGLSEIESARRNSALLMQKAHGVLPTALFAHAPIPQLRSVAEELEVRYAEDFDRTMRSAFRAHSDIEPNSWLHMSELEFSGRAEPSSARCGYFYLGRKDARQRLAAAFADASLDVLCLNDGASEDGVDYSHWLESLLRRACPVTSKFEALCRSPRR